MRFFKRGLMFGALVASVAAIAAAPASAGISPSPYTLTSADSGSLVTVTPLGTSTCVIGGLAGSLATTGTGVSGSATAATLSGCSGVIQRATVLPPVTITLTNTGLTVSVNGNILVVTALGSCLYGGTLRGTWTSPTRSITATNTAIPLLRTLSGFCSSSANVTLRFTLASATVTNPALP